MSRSSDKKDSSTSQRDALICLFLVIATLLVYWQVSTHEFVYYDDDVYVSGNRHVQAGLTSKSIAWAFTTTYASNWHPLTWLSHMMDCELFGLDSGRHHLTSVFFHIANTVLLFLILRSMTGESHRSGFVAALFALHPLHVESVAWLAERKDVLSSLFWMLTIWSYTRYVKQPSPGRYALIILFFMLGLMSKPMLVTLPFVLLLLDYWPLGRIRFDAGIDSWKKSFDFRLILEKIPLFALTFVSCIVTFIAQHAGGAVKSLVHYPLGVRIANALVSYAVYLEKTFLPFGLALMYPHPGHPPRLQVAVAGIVLLAGSALALGTLKRHPYLFVGWVWYLGTLVPVIGLVQVGNQAMADRYTYIPLIGIFIMTAWGVPALTEQRWRRLKSTHRPAAAAFLLVLWVTTLFQTGYWRDNVSLFKRSLAVNPENATMHNTLGFVLNSQGKHEEAIHHYKTALSINPDYIAASHNLSVLYRKRSRILASEGRAEEAERFYNEALRLQREYAPAGTDPHGTFAGRHPTKIQKTGVEAMQESIRKNPAAYYKTGTIYQANCEWEKAIEQYEKALSIQPDYAPAINNMALVYGRRGEYEKAISLYLRIIELEPEIYIPYYNIACIHSKQGRIDASVEWLKKAVEKGFNDRKLLETDEDLEDIRGTVYYEQLVSALGGK